MTSRKIVCKKLSTNFRECTEIVSFTPRALKSGEVLVQVKYVGINASDINYTNGAYLPGVQPPFDCGFEAGAYKALCGRSLARTDTHPRTPIASTAVGIVTEVGPGVKTLKKGDAVASMCTFRVTCPLLMT